MINDTWLHCHTEGSNLRMRDCIIKTKELIDYAIEKGMKAVAITDHASLSEHIHAMKYAQELEQKGETIKVLLGDEIYLVDNVEEIQENYQGGGKTKFYHFILIAKNRKGYEQLLRINDMGWKSSFMTGKMRRVPNDKSQLEKIIGDEKGNLIASTACLGGELANLFVKGEEQKAREFVEWCITLFTKDCFAIEIQPSFSEEQIAFNKWAMDLADEYGLRCIVTCDIHYLKEEHHDIHRAFRYSSDSFKEIDEEEDFYATTWGMNYDEKYEYLDYIPQDKYDQIVNNGWELVKDCESFSMEHQTIIPERKLDGVDFKVRHIFKDWYDKYEYLSKFAHSPYDQDQFFLSMVEDGFLEKKEEFNETNIGRINWEMEQLWLISDKLGARMSAYYNLVDFIVDLCWEIGYVGISRGSVTGYYTAYLIDIQQLNPIKWDLPAYRHLNAQRVSWPDVDLDTSARNRPKIIQRLKEAFGEYNILNICTFKTETSKAALKTVCKGLGISLEEAGYLSSLVPVERGRQWSLKDCFEGNENEDKKPIAELVKETNDISKQLNIDFKEYAFMIEGLVSGLSLHASGIYIFKDGYIKQNSLMKTPRGDSVTCWSMEDSDWCGGLKYDSLTTQAQDRLEVCSELLLKNQKVDWQGDIRSTYNSFLHPNVLNYDNHDMWEECCNGEIADLFQFETPVGGQCIQKVKPHSIVELANANSLMRITVEGEEQPVDKFLRYKQDRTQWYRELKEYGVTDSEEIKELERILGYCYGAPSMQEDVMELCMSPKVAGFSLADADKARKIIAKKKKNDVAGLKEKFYDSVQKMGNSINVANYVWEACIKPQLAYSFSRNHVLPYSAEALQEMNLYHFFAPVYWNCATLIVNSGLADEDNTKGIKYDKLTKGIYKALSSGIAIAPPSPNKSELSFSPQEENNSILFGLGSIAKINTDIATQIIANRPYADFKDFYHKNSYPDSLIKNQHFIQLIKAGCFDEFNPDRVKVMKQYVVLSTETKDKLTMQNLDSILKLRCPLPKPLSQPIKFKKYVCSKRFYFGQHPNFKTKKLYWLDQTAMRYFIPNCQPLMQEGVDYWEEEGRMVVVDKSLEKVLKPIMENLKEYINTPEFIKEYNKCLYRAKYQDMIEVEDVNKWSFEALSYYSLEHELAHVDFDRYNISHFADLPEEPQFIERSWGKRSWRQYDISAICGTILAKSDNNHLVTILTQDDEVVNCKLSAGQFAHYKAQLSEIGADGKKTIVEKPWISRGQLVIVCGYRRGDDFVCKKYSNSVFQHTMMKIEKVYEDGSLDIISERYNEEDE